MDSRTNDRLAQALALAAHDLRNALHVARSGSELLVSDDPLSVDVRDAVETLARAVDRIVETAVVGAADAPRREQLPLDDLLALAVQRARRAGVGVATTQVEPAATVHVDSAAAERVIADELLLASIDAAGAGLLVEQGRTRLTVTVTDTAPSDTADDAPPARDALVAALLPVLAEAAGIVTLDDTRGRHLDFAIDPPARTIVPPGAAATSAQVDPALELASAPDLATCLRLAHAFAREVAGIDEALVETHAGFNGSEGAAATPPTGPGWQARELGSDASWHARLWLRTGGAVDEPALELFERRVSFALDLLHRRATAAATERSHLALIEAGKSLAQELTLRGVLRRIVELSCELVDCQYGALGVIDETGAQLSEFITVGIDDVTHARIGELPRGLGLLGVLIEDPRPLRLEHMQSDPRSYGFPPHHPPMESFLGVPIVTRRKVKGRLYLTEKHGSGSFTEHDERIAMALASQAAIAIENAELYEAMTATSEELARANLQLQEADRHKSAFLANMSHELRTPLNSIIGYATLLLDAPDELTTDQVEDLRIIHGSSTHLLTLIGDLLDLSQIETGHVELQLAQVDAGRVVREVAASLRPQADETGIELTVDAAQDVELRCDRSRLRQILLNVAANAVKFTPGGSVALALRATDDHAVFEVRDTGVGIPEADLARIFDTFFQSSAALARTPRAHEGAGLGLAITKDLAELHGGRVEISSIEGSGTTVRILLPIGGPPAGSVGPGPEAAS